MTVAQHNRWALWAFWIGWGWTCTALALPLSSATNRPVLGRPRTAWLRYDASQPFTNAQKKVVAVTNVQVAGTWDIWTGRTAMVQSGEGVWELDARTLGARLGQHRFKFIVNGEWEPGANRVLPINLDGEIELPPAMIQRAAIDGARLIRVFFRKSLPAGITPVATVDPAVPVAWTEVVTEMADARQTGYLFAEGLVTFLFDPAAYGLELPTNTQVVVAGNFNGWDSGGGNPQWVLEPGRLPGTWEGSVQLEGMRLPPGEKELLFKFVLNGREWLLPPTNAPNALPDGKGSVNLKLDLFRTGGAEIRIHTEDPLDLTQTYVVRLDGIGPSPLGVEATPDGVFDEFYSDKPMGVTLDKERGITTYRLFAPRARNAWLNFFDGPMAVKWKPTFQRLPPTEEYRMWKDPADGVWEISTRGLDTGRFYGFRVDGPFGEGESFDALNVVGDPYGRAAANADGLTIVVDPEETNRWFRGWTDQDWKTPAPQDVMIYECHVRGMTVHPSSRAPAPLRGTYAGLTGTLGKGTGLDHLKDLGVNTIELLPVNEFSESTDPYNWGYATVYYFAPESSYATEPEAGSAYFELKQLVNDLHNEGFAVVLDVVYNHVGGPNIFVTIDRKYYFRLNPDLSFSNHSACGNDLKTEAPMLRKLIVDNIRYFMEEFHVDGFRLDLAELIDMQTMLAIRDAALAINPHAILISEPWSPGRGENKYQLRETRWSAWNNDFRYAAKDFARGRGNREWLAEGLFGSVNTWARNPLQPVNYLESHDDMAFMDEISSNPGHDGRRLRDEDVARNRLAATLLFTALGKPMIYEGQEFLRSKWGIVNTYNRGDAVNAVRWADRERPLAKQALGWYRGLMQLRRSKEGAAFRVAQRPPRHYYRWILPDNPKLLGYMVNVPDLHAGRGFCVLLNADTEDHPIPVNLRGETAWRLIGNGREIALEGVTALNSPAGAPPPTWPSGWSGSITVPALESVILMNGF
ncbi:MAG: alpha-amylase family glycosyl hydrolase [Kiritimatiellae bacterium]|nr:alpha-amylase family glycosyl hydrolase [Kiritimatiellia bacterium]